MLRTEAATTSLAFAVSYAELMQYRCACNRAALVSGLHTRTVEEEQFSGGSLLAAR
jgi:hypothetical protein